jgi:hypothetical protein
MQTRAPHRSLDRGTDALCLAVCGCFGDVLALRGHGITEWGRLEQAQSSELTEERVDGVALGAEARTLRRSVQHGGCVRAQHEPEPRVTIHQEAPFGPGENLHAAAQPSTRAPGLR